jgi:hypothetical protein
MIVPVLAAAVAVSSAAPAASDSPIARPTLRAVRAENPPSLDGRLDDEAWKSAPASSAFTQKFPREGAAPNEATTIRVVYDDRALFIGVDCVQEQAKEGGKHLLWSVSWDGASRRLDFNDVGYMRRQAYQHVAGELVLRTLSPIGPFQEAFAFLDVYHRRNLDGLDLQTGTYAGAWARTPGYYKLYLASYFEGTHLDDREIGDGASLERPWMLGGEGSITSDPRSAFAWKLHADVARLALGWSATADATLTLRPTPALDLSLGPTLYWTLGEPRFVGSLPGNTPDERAYLLGALTAKNVSAVLRGTYTFTPRLTLQAYAQLFLASGHYADFTRGVATEGSRAVPIAGRTPAAPPTVNPDFFDGALNVNLVLRWEFRLGSVLWLVLSRAQAPNVTLGPGEVGSLAFASVRRAPAVDVALLKLSFWFGS